MPQMTAIVLNDGTADHTFNPSGTAPNGVHAFVESSGVPMAEKSLTVSQTRTAAGRRKVTLKMVIPIVQDATVEGITQPRIVRTAYADVTFSFDAGSQTVERNDLRLMLVDLLGDSQAFAGKIIDDLENLF